MELLLLSFFTVGIAEFGDKSQLITLYLAGKNHRTWHMLVGMATASLINHYMAAWVGVAVHDWLSGNVLRIISGAIFILIGVFSWKHEDAQKMTVFNKKMPALLTCFLFYFVAEAADKTQIATAALAAYNHTVWMIVFGATLGMIAANLPVIYLGKQFGKRVPLDTLKKVAAVLFVVIGVFMIGSLFL